MARGNRHQFRRGIWRASYVSEDFSPAGVGDELHRS